MMMKKRDGIQTIRPGRNLYTRAIVSRTPLLNLVWVHGTCAKSSQFDAVVEKMSATNAVVDCYLYDAMGCGQSPILSEWDAYTTKEAALDLRAFLEKCIEDKSLPTVVIGHSYAVTVIIRMLAQDQHVNVAACVFLSSALKGSPVSLHNRGHPVFMLPVVLLKCLQPFLTKEFIRLAYHPEADPALLEASNDADNANDMYMCKAYHVHHDWATVEEATSNIRVPCLVIHGREDKVVPVEGGQHLADMTRGKLVIVERASHQVMEKQPEQVAEAIWEWLNNHVLK